MEIHVGEESQSEIKQTLISSLPEAPKQPKSKTQKAIRKTFKGTAHLAKLLPTGSVLAFQILCPILTHQGQCPTSTSHFFTLALLFLCAASCFVLCFTDSFKDERGKVRYGIATVNGLWVIDGGSVPALAAADACKYKLQLLDFVHAVMSALVFVAVATFDQNVVKCLFPEPSDEVKEILTGLPVAVGIFCGSFFLLFPTRRHGIGFPLTKE